MSIVNKKIFIFSAVLLASILIWQLFSAGQRSEDFVVKNFAEQEPALTHDNYNGIISNGENQLILSPLEKAEKRVIKKPFGIFVSPQNSPIQSERFRGYHTGADFEIFPDEENAAILVRAICEGNLRTKQIVSGYGGTVVQDCKINGEDVTILYGHLSLESVKKEVNSKVMAGEVVGRLGDPTKSETDGERKHLHLAIHKGTRIDFRGYVNSQIELLQWIDPCEYLCR